MRLQFSPTDGDAAVAFGLEQEAGLFGDLPALQGRLDSLLGEGDAILSDFLAKGFDGELLALSGLISHGAASLLLGRLVQGSSLEEVDGLEKNLVVPNNTNKTLHSTNHSGTTILAKSLGTLSQKHRKFAHPPSTPTAMLI